MTPRESTPVAGSVRTDLAEAVAAGRHVAVVSDPGGGRATLLDHAASLVEDARRVCLSGLADDRLTVPEHDPLLLENCQYLFARRVDGFGPLARLTERLADTDTQVVTSWNRYAWEYLVAVKRVDDLFEAVVDVPALEREDIEALLLDDDVLEPEYGLGSAADGSDRVVSLPGGFEVRLPALEGLRDGFRDRVGPDDPEAVRTRVFETVTEEADGNPAAARAIWDRALTDGTVTVSAVREAVPSVELTDDEGFILQVVLSNERLARSQLAAVAGEQLTDRGLRRLRRQDLVAVEDGQVSLRPAALPSAVDFLSRRRLLW